jgi:hypothetical protein
MIGLIVFHDFKSGMNRIGRDAVLKQFDANIRAFSVDRAVIIDVADTLELGVHPYLICVDDLEEALAEFQGWEHVYLTQNGETDLKDYTHPDRDVVYIIGSDFLDLITPPGATTLRVSTPGTMELFASTVAGILLYQISE